MEKFLEEYGLVDLFCKNCKFFYGTEVGVSMEFVTPHGKTDRPQIFNRLESYPFGFVKMCQHKACFKESWSNTPVKHKKDRTRVMGQAQLNSDNHCCYYKRKWWKFWV